MEIRRPYRYKRIKHLKPSWHLLAIAALLWSMLVAGCIFKDLKQEIQEENVSYGLTGRVDHGDSVQGDVFILLYNKRDDVLHIERFTLPDDNGYFSFIVTAGHYLLAGFEDLNGNRRHDPGEPAGMWGEPDEIVVPEGPKTEARKKALMDFKIRLRPDQFPVPDVTASTENVELAADALFKIGQVADWNDPVFDDEHGATGFWKPMTFLKQHGAGIYIMAPYDRNKIPILFVHGASGTPRGWKSLADSLDPQRFQPWVFYYPSGLRLAFVATALNKMVKRLQREYGFERMGIVAHSMGGLVSRAFILKHLVEDGMQTVQVFVSISTPWGGVRMAAEGVEHAPEAIPSWKDVAPQSGFIKDIYQHRLYSRVSHCLMFGYRGDCSLFMSNNDGTVEVSSQLDVRAQEDAAWIWGLDEDHMSIIESEKTMEYLNRALTAVFIGS